VSGVLHRCNPLRAWLSVRQCDFNARHAAKASKRPTGDEMRVAAAAVLGTCVGCPGVIARGDGTRYLPELQSAAPAPSAPSDRAPTIHRRLHPATWRPPAGTVTVLDLERETRLARTTIYQRLRDAGVKPTVRGRASRPACYPAEAARVAARGVA
jgi:hypothetical protein